jgi:hypothetical protein
LGCLKPECLEEMKHHMKRLLAALILVPILNCVERTHASSLITNPVVMVTPMVLDFGVVKTNSTVTNTFLIENAGGGKLVGKASVSPPFKIISGGTYSLKENTAQIVTITYTPSRAPVDSQTVTFTGGGGAKAIATGKRSGAPPPRT